MEIVQPGDHPLALQVDRRPAEIARRFLLHADNLAVEDQQVALDDLRPVGVDDPGVGQEQILRQGDRRRQRQERQQANESCRSVSHQQEISSGRPGFGNDVTS